MKKKTIRQKKNKIKAKVKAPLNKNASEIPAGGWRNSSRMK